MVKLYFWRSEVIGESLSMPLLPGPLWTGVFVPVRVLSMDQIDVCVCVCVCRGARNVKVIVAENGYEAVCISHSTMGKYYGRLDSLALVWQPVKEKEKNLNKNLLDSAVFVFRSQRKHKATGYGKKPKKEGFELFLAFILFCWPAHWFSRDF